MEGIEIYDLCKDWLKEFKFIKLVYVKGREKLRISMDVRMYSFPVLGIDRYKIRNGSSGVLSVVMMPVCQVTGGRRQLIERKREPWR